MWQLRHWLQFLQLRTWIHDNLCYLTIKSDTGHSQVPQPTLGSGLGLHCPYRRGIFLSTLPARPIWTAHGQGGAYWIAPHLRKPHAQARLFSLTDLAVCTPFLSSARMQLLLETGIAVGFLIFQLSDFLRQNATFVFAENKCKCICQAVHFIFLLCRGSPIRVSANGGRPFSGAQKVVVFTLAA